MRKLVWKWGPVLAYMILIFYFSSQTILPGPVKTLSINDKILHSVEFGILSLLFKRAWKLEKMKHATLLAIISTIVYGALDEFHQYFIPGRTMDFWDFVADGFGGLVVLLF